MSTRDDILDIAYEAFAEKGYRGTSLGYIADKIGVTRPALYYHFPSKEDLFKAVYERIDPLVSATPDAVEAAQDEKGYREAFNDLMRSIFGNLRNDPSRARFVAAVESAAYQSPEIMEEVHRQDAAICNILSRALHRGEELGVLREDVSRDAAIEFLNVVFNGASEVMLRGGTFSWTKTGPIVCDALFK